MRSSETASPLEYVSVPVVGQVGAGRSVEYLPSVKLREVRLPSWARGYDRFVLIEVCGSSLKYHRIFNGDFALVHINAEVRPGDLVAALTPEGMMIKYVYPDESGRVRLESANEAKFPAKIFEVNEVLIQGKVIRVERDL